MTNHAHTPHFWNTATFGGNTETSPLDLQSLEDHLGVCKSPNGDLFALHCAAESARGFLANRFVTTLVVVALLIGIAVFAL